MKRLVVLYNGSIKDKCRDSYLKAIRVGIPDVDIRDMSKDGIDAGINSKHDKLLILKPYTTMYKKYLKKIFEKYPQCDIEGVFTKKVPVTVEAILRVLPEDLKGKSVVIINQSEDLGIPLMNELAKKKANIVSLNSSVKRPMLYKKLFTIAPDIVITATGGKKFTLLGSSLRNTETVIDLSDDTDISRAIRKVPVIEILKERLEDE